MKGANRGDTLSFPGEMMGLRCSPDSAMGAPLNRCGVPRTPQSCPGGMTGLFNFAGER
jgi:hypothetical protein